MNLEETISAYTANVAKRAPPQVLASLRAEIQKLSDSGIARNALAVGSRSPAFTLPNALGGEITLSEVLEKGPAVVTFYRGGWCPFCDLQLRAYQEILPQIRQLGAELIAISPQTPDYALSDVEKKALSFPVLTDAQNTVARRFGLVFQLSDVLKQVQTSFGSVLPKFNGDESWELPMPGTFVLDRAGIVRLAHVDPDYWKRLEPAELLKGLEAIKL